VDAVIHLFLHLTQLYSRLILSSEQTPKYQTLVITYVIIYNTLNKIVHPNFLSSVEHSFLKNVGDQKGLVLTNLHCMDKKIVPQKKDRYTVLE